MAPFAAPFMARALAELGLLALICGPVSVFVFVRRLSFTADRLAVMAIIGTALTCAAGYLGLQASWVASVDHGLRLTSASAIVLILVLAYLAALPIGAVRGRRARAS
jgi:ABC-type Mn2+/Zn2+ transport system permease subunit